MNYRAGNPSAIKCNRCNIVKNAEAFSKNRLEFLRDVLHGRGNAIDPRRHAQISCIGCSGRQVHELQCNLCNVTKPLDKFAKAQRKNRDRALCIPCSFERTNLPTNAESLDQASSSDGGPYSSDDDSDDEDDEYCASVTTGSIAPSRSVASSHTATTISQLSSMTESTARSLAGMTVSSRAASVTSQSIVGAASPARTGGTMGQTKSGSSGRFAKVRAAPPPVQRELDVSASAFDRLAGWENGKKNKENENVGARAGGSRFGGGGLLVDDGDDSDDREVTSEPESDGDEDDD